ncbi:MAG: glutamine synthetase III [Clostridia bacterium]|nr:glutamine synthetase III [Clostridia bacterium]MBQ9133208.1 glutamine synthetase III [Clostridia bacterium]
MENPNRIPELFGSLVFNDRVMQAKLPKDVYKSLKKTIEEDAPLEIDVANVVANAMKEWALENGATHYTHWFQPMTGITAEKHDSFIEPVGDSVVMELSGKSLVKGETDASSFPSGGLRATFEARGYTAWDPTSYAFIKDKTLCIPTVFCSFGGQVLDKKAPLLRSMEAVSAQAMRVLRLFGHTNVAGVRTTVGAEQEYFLVDKEMFDAREDLRLCGRTLFGAKPPRGQSLDVHYFGTIKPRVKAFMEELNDELWKLGITSKTEHNEAAPAQHELAPIFSTTNIANDHNQLIMELMKKVARKHGLVCLLNEKPFAGVNGSGKHNNFSISTKKGKNLLSPGDSPADNAQFLIFLSAVIKAVDEYSDLLRISVASAGNDHRLGAAEAPPAIVSIFLGSELTEILDCIEADKPYEGKEAQVMKIGASVLPDFPMDNTDRNRTSPFAFTGNKFEFRMLGSSLNISEPNVVLNTAVAESLKQIADILETADDFDTEVHNIVKRVYSTHKKVIFNGDGYSEEWHKEAERRGLPNYRTVPDAIPHLKDEKNIKLFTDHKIYTEEEVISRTEITLDSYCKTVKSEAHVMSDMVKRQILPAVQGYMSELSNNALSKKSLGINVMAYETETLKELSEYTDKLYKATVELDSLTENIPAESREKAACHFRDKVLTKMAEVREYADALEVITADEYWPFPTYKDLLYGVN